MNKMLVCVSLFSASAFGQYKLESAGAPPADLAPAIQNTLQKNGARISGGSGVVCEVWFRTSVPSSPNNEQNASFTNVAQGTLLGVVRFPTKGSDRRGQPIQPGTYTLRLSFYPVDGAHQGVAPTRDFVLLSNVSNDTDPASTPDFSQLVAMSKKASGRTHPLVLNVWKPDAGAPVTLKQEGDDWVLYDSLGDRPIAMIVVGTYSGT